MKHAIATSLGALALLLAGCGGGDEAANGSGTVSNAPITQIPAPNGGEWTQVVSQTPEGGMMMGNPNAPVKVVEFASLTCGACAGFAEEGEPKLIDKYVKSGQVSFEMRNFVRDGADLAASLIARCNGPAAFFKLSDQLFAAQGEWLGQLQGMTPQEQQAILSMPPGQQAMAFAQRAGLDQFARVRGIPAAKAQACLTDEAEIKRLVAMKEQAVREYSVPGTPSWVINGRSLGSMQWDGLEPQIQAALPR